MATTSPAGGEGPGARGETVAVALLAEAAAEVGVAEQFQNRFAEGLTGVRSRERDIYSMYQTGGGGAGEENARLLRSHVIEQLDGETRSARSGHHRHIGCGE